MQLHYKKSELGNSCRIQLRFPSLFPSLFPPFVSFPSFHIFLSTFPLFFPLASKQRKGRMSIPSICTTDGAKTVVKVKGGGAVFVFAALHRALACAAVCRSPLSRFASPSSHSAVSLPLPLSPLGCLCSQGMLDSLGEAGLPTGDVEAIFNLDEAFKDIISHASTFRAAASPNQVPIYSMCSVSGFWSLLYSSPLAVDAAAFGCRGFAMGWASLLSASWLAAKAALHTSTNACMPRACTWTR